MYYLCYTKVLGDKEPDVCVIGTYKTRREIGVMMDRVHVDMLSVYSKFVKYKCVFYVIEDKHLSKGCIDNPMNITRVLTYTKKPLNSDMNLKTIYRNYNWLDVK